MVLIRRICDLEVGVKEGECWFVGRQASKRSLSNRKRKGYGSNNIEQVVYEEVGKSQKGQNEKGEDYHRIKTCLKKIKNKKSKLSGIQNGSDRFRQWKGYRDERCRNEASRKGTIGYNVDRNCVEKVISVVKNRAASGTRKVQRERRN